VRKKDPEKQEAILSAAVRVFANHGFHAAKMSKIAEEAGVAAGSLYLYFQNKDAILMEVIESTWREMIRRYAKNTGRTDISPMEKLGALIDVVFDMFVEDPARMVIFVNEKHQLEQKGTYDFSEHKAMLLEMGGRVMQEGVALGAFDERVDIRLFKEFIFGGLHHVLNLWALQPEAIDLQQMREKLKRIIENSIRK